MITLHAYLTAAAAGHVVVSPTRPNDAAHGGGSRSGYMGLVRALGRLGKYDITAYGPFTTRAIDIDGVKYRRIDGIRPTEYCDVAIAYYDGQPLFGKNARLRVHSLHTYTPLNPFFPFPHVWTAPSQHTAEFFRRAYRPHDPIHVVPNAVEGLDGVEWRPVPGRVLYHFSPDRGLHHLLECWPTIRQRVPNATLHIGGDPDGIIKYDTMMNMDGIYEFQRSLAMARRLKIAKAAGGVTMLGRLPRDELLREISEASVAAFPCECAMPSETFSVSVLECCAIGVPVVLAPEDALGEVYANSGVVLTRAPVDRYLHKFCDAVCDVLTSEQLQRGISLDEREFAKGFSFERTAAAMDSVIERHLLKAVG